jgi:spore germination protein
MKPNSGKLPDSLIMAMLTHIYIGWGLLYLAKLAIAHLSYNAYWGIFVALAIILPFQWIIWQLVRSYPGLSVSRIFQKIFGKPLGTGLVLILFSYIAYFQIIFFRDSQLMVYTYFFQRTPFMLITGSLIAGILYVSLRGPASVGRLALFMLLPPIMVIFGLQLLGFTNVNLLNLQPVFNGPFLDWFMAGTDLIIVLLPGVGTILFFPFFQHSDTARKIGIASLAMVIPLFFLNLLGIIGTFGPAVMEKMNWPVVEYFHLIDYPFLLLEQTGLFFLIAWYASIFVTLSTGVTFVGAEFQTIFPRIHRKWFTLAYCILLWITVNLPINMLTSESFFIRTQKWMAFSYLAFLLVTWIVARFNKDAPANS